MYYKLTEKEIKDFSSKYLPIWENDINNVTRIDYNGIIEYMINDHYLVLVYKNKVISKDLQEL